MKFSRVVVGVAVLGVVAGSLTTEPAFAGPSIGALAGAGQRPNATRLSFTAGDSVKAQVDVGSGNLLVTVNGIKLPGVNAQVTVGAHYNSAASSQTLVPRLGRGWGIDPSTDIKIVVNPDNSLTYSGPGGLTGVFDPVTGSTTQYMSPAGFKVSMVKSGSTWTLTDHASQQKMNFNAAGLLTSVVDRDGNSTAVTATTGAGSFANVNVVSTAGPTNARTAAIVTNAYDTSTVISQTNTTDSRQVSFARPGSDMTSFTDAINRSTTFSYVSNGLISSIAAPGGVTTNFTYDASRRVSSISQVETAAGGPGTSVTRLAYVSSTETDLADPTTDQTLAVTAVPHTTYTLNADQRVVTAKDAQNRLQAATYTANFDTQSSSVGSAGSDSTTSNTWGANGTESLTKSASPAGAASTLSYANASGPAQYQPTGSTSGAGVSSTYAYSTSGNAQSTTDGGGAVSTLTYNTNGTVATAAAPKSATNKTIYGYTNGQTSQITPKTGTGLGIRNLTYDSFGRTLTATNGRGITATYSYDKLDRITSTSFSDGASVTYGYDTAGRNSTRTDVNGTTTYGYDQLGRMTSRVNTAGGGTFGYNYNKASWLTSSTSPTGGTITYTYDLAGKVATITYPYLSGTRQMVIYTDSHGRRNELWFGSNPTHTTWVGHVKYAHDKSDRVIQVTAEQGTGDTDNTPIINTTYCYQTGTVATHSCTGGVDSFKLQWQKDNLSGVTTDYTYTTSGRLAGAAVSGAPDYTYGYDTNGNRTTAGTQTLTFDNANKITTTGYTYDAAGNLTATPSLSSIAYTSADQMKSVIKAGTTYNYTHAGADQNELLSENTPNGIYSLAYGRPDQYGRPTIESATRTTGATDTANVISDPTTGQPLILRTSSGMQSMYVYDGTPGSPIALITSAAYTALAYSYDPYGVPTLTADSGGNGVDQNPYLFAGGVQDRTTGWVHFGNRYYDPTTGTWTQQDTLDTPLDPANANRYSYASGDPVNNTDLSGQGVYSCILGVLGYTTGAIAFAASAVATGGITAYALALYVLASLGYLDGCKEYFI